MPSPDPIGIPAPAGRWRKAALAVFLTAYFLAFNWGSLRVRFALDDLSNLRYYFDRPLSEAVLANFTPWTGIYRPLGALFYLPVYHFAGLNPVPYQAVLLFIVLAGVYFAYRLVRLLDGGELAAALTAMVCCYHAGVANLYYNAAFCYDAMCFCLYLAALGVYVGIRSRGRVLSVWQTVVFLALLLAALNAKEMAVSIAPMMLVYELLYRAPEKKDWRSLLHWAKGPARTIWFAGIVTLLDIYGKMAGPNAMTATDAYRPVFTLERLHVYEVNVLQDLLVSWTWTPGWGAIIGVYVVLAILAWRPHARPILRFLFCYLLIVPLPIEFLEGRRQACFALLMAGGAAFVAVVFSDAVQTLAAFLSREFKPSLPRGLFVGIMVLAAVFLWAREQRQLRRFVGGTPMTSLGWESWDILEQLHASSFHPRPGSTVVFQDDPFHTFDMYIIARLWFHDRSIHIRGVNGEKLSPQDLAKVDYIFRFDGRKLIQVR